MNKIELGKFGEELARDFLLEKGYEILAENYRTPLGEIDLVVKEGNTIVFVEVRTRSSKIFGTPLESITPRKQERLIRLAIHFCVNYSLYSQNFRFDVIGIFTNKYESKIEHIMNAFIIGGE